MINIANDQLIFFKEEINNIPQALKNKNNTNKFNEEKEKKQILKEIEELEKVITYNDSENSDKENENLLIHDN